VHQATHIGLSFPISVAVMAKDRWPCRMPGIFRGSAAQDLGATDEVMAKAKEGLARSLEGSGTPVAWAAPVPCMHILQLYKGRSFFPVTLTITVPVCPQSLE
jgi:hypothetical protein